MDIAVVIKLINALLAVVFGVLGALLLYWVLNKIVERLPNKLEDLSLIHI